MTTYYKAIPLWKDNSRKLFIQGWGITVFIGDDEIVRQKFSSLKDAVIAAKSDGTPLRPANYEQNYGWEFSKYEGFWRTKTIIPMESIKQMGLFSEKVDQDNISKIYYISENL